MKETDKNADDLKVSDNCHALIAKLQELETVYNENEMTILGLYRNLENSRKQVDDNERQIRNANVHQQGLQREIDDLKKIVITHKKEEITAS